MPTASGAGNATLPNPKPLVIALNFCRVPCSVGSYKTASIFSKTTKNLDMYLSVDSQGPLASRYCYFYTRFGKTLHRISVSRLSFITSEWCPLSAFWRIWLGGSKNLIRCPSIHSSKASMHTVASAKFSYPCWYQYLAWL